MTTDIEIINLYTKYHYRLVLPVTLNMKEKFINTYHLHLDILVLLLFRFVRVIFFFLKVYISFKKSVSLILKKGEVCEVLILRDDVMILSFSFVFGCG